MFSSLRFSLYGETVTLHETNYHYKAEIKKHLNYGSDALVTYLVSRFWDLDLPGELKENKGYTTPLNYVSNSQIIERHMEDPTLNC